MNAIKFIKNNGVDKAREVLSGAPEGATHLSDDACHYVNADFKPLPAHIKEQLPKLIVLNDLKRLVKSVERVDSYGGLGLIEYQVRCLGQELSDSLRQAIADYESIYEVK